MPGLPFSGWELLLILAIALIVLGPGKLPDLGAAMGKTIREFRKAATDVQEAVNAEPEPAAPPPSTATAAAHEREPDPALPPSVESTAARSRDPAAPVEPMGLSTPPAPAGDEPATSEAGRRHVGG